MKGSLIVITFDQQDRADTVFEALHAMRRRALYSLDEALVVTHSRQGVIRLHHSHTLANTQSPHTLDKVVELMFADEGDQFGRFSNPQIKTDLAATGFDVRFLEFVGKRLQSDTSAIFFLVRRASLGDADEIIKVLTLFHGDIAQTTVSAESEQYFAQLD